jgi:hypothetical protein
MCCGHDLPKWFRSIAPKDVAPARGAGKPHQTLALMSFPVLRAATALIETVNDDRVLTDVAPMSAIGCTRELGGS